MAVIERGNLPQSAAANVGQGRDQVAKMVFHKVVDLNDPTIPEGETTELDKTADAYSFAKPVPHGIYQLGLFLAPDGLRWGQSDPNDPTTLFFTASLDCRIISDNKEYNGLTVQEDVTTTVFRGQRISQMATLIVKAGYSDKLPASTSSKFQAKFLLAMLKKEPKVFAEVDWRAWTRNEVNPRTGKSGRWLLRGMEKFPQLEDGTFEHATEDKTGELCYARLYVQRWLTRDEAKAASITPAKKAIRVEQAIVAGVSGVSSDLDISGIGGSGVGSTVDNLADLEL